MQSASSLNSPAVETSDRVRVKRRRSRNTWSSYLAIVPAGLVAAIYVGTMAWTIWISFPASKMLPVNNFVGFDQYQRLFQDQRWQISATNLVIYCVLFIGISLVLGLMLAIALDVKPDYVTLVPEKREEVTTEGGLDIAGQIDRLALVVDKLQTANIPVSLFIDATESQIEASVKVKAKFIELHTGTYAEAADEASREQELAVLARGCDLAIAAGLRVNAGHGLTYWNVYQLSMLIDQDR